MTVKSELNYIWTIIVAILNRPRPSEKKNRKLPIIIIIILKKLSGLTHGLSIRGSWTRIWANTSEFIEIYMRNKI